MEKLKETLDYLNSQTASYKPEIAVILGSGLGVFCDDLKGITVKYTDIPHFSSSSIQGHKGELLFSVVEGKPAVIMQGRFHYYEGNPMDVCTYPIRVFKKMGVKTVFITNAAGAINKSYKVGDIMMFCDHINFMGDNPLIGRYDGEGERFPDMSNLYTPELSKLAKVAAGELNIDLKEGVYLATSGPSYETKAEIKAYSILGADVVGMSSAPEAIVAGYLNMNVIAFSLVTNHAAGISSNKLSHAEVLETGKKSGIKLANLIKKIISKL